MGADPAAREGETWHSTVLVQVHAAILVALLCGATPLRLLPRYGALEWHLSGSGTRCPVR